MPLLPAFLLLAQGVANTHLDIPILHRRPSKIAKILNNMGDPRVLFVPDDEASTMRLIGTKEDVEEFKSRIALFDNAPRKIRLAVRVENPLNHASWKGEVETGNNETWMGGGGGTEVTLSIAGRINDDGTCTMFLTAKSPDAKTISVVTRVGLGKEQTFEMPAFGIHPASAKPKWLPKFSVKFLGDAD